MKTYEYCEEGICTYFCSLEEQYAREEDGIPADYCYGTEDDIRECFDEGIEFNERSER